MATANNPGLGTLGRFPREIRDKIYRYLVKDRYTIEQSLYASSLRAAKRVLRSPTQQSDFAIMRGSKATHHEASSILYSESVFQFCIYKTYQPAYDSNIYPQESVLHRMMKIEFVFPRGYWHKTWYSHILDVFTRPGTRRTSLLVHFNVWNLEMGLILLEELSNKLKAFVSFPAVIVHVEKDPYDSQRIDHEQRRKGITKVVEQILVPPLGSATVDLVDSTLALELYTRK